ncbi:aspartate/glutamate racemase family protein [Cobetia sp. LC6]|uniref:aspartate/glutamate racemase family protein n=1 Tax=Cobetia sp. LC6 TaxID=3050947 RepID=UPI00255261FD|nr:aspartate/glutamate racemase family protein [Cobetia sp. LC6]MDL2191417.1 aspartate/glutamate racemase family protein [Cobetia sp. LC6]
MQDTELRQRNVIGILTGSGPDAGLDLWNKLLIANKARVGPGYRGDLDAPHVHLISQPALGLSMELESHEQQVWEALSDSARKLAEHVDYYAIACNTLNYYQPQLEALALNARLVSFNDVVIDRVRRDGLEKVALLGAKSVTDMGDWSPYRALAEVVEVEVPGDPHLLHQIIYDVKARGGDDPSVVQRFHALLESLSSGTVLLACTELPLIPVSTVSSSGNDTAPAKTLIDVTELVAEELARKSCGA